ncbi:hypothetical protein [Methylobacterium brachiatum]|uniref:hypothetical protein n=1 Tax=Methylobacterium brachiatum TaxID=269660 RepID=UPI0008F21DC5|nr:hypothetical protein [Methylobacterium brachiatum]SFI05829.1 hypothetical protein SAMN02799642_00579 [Methylobacterium brachiatum]
MCDPLTIAGAALTAGGIAANSIGASQAAAASSRAYNAERQRQAQLRQEAAQVQQHANSLYENFAGKQADRASDLTAYLRGNQLPAQGSAQTTVEAPATGSNITTQGEASQRASADRYASQQAGALADMRSFGDLLGTNALAQGRDAGRIGQIGNFMRGSATVLPIELNAASHAGDTAKLVGGIAGGLGKVGIAAGINGSTLGGLFGAADTGSNVATSLPTMAASGMGSIANAYAGLPIAPMTLAQPFGAAPSFASSPYRV